MNLAGILRGDWFDSDCLLRQIALRAGLPSSAKGQVSHCYVSSSLDMLIRGHSVPSRPNPAKTRVHSCGRARPLELDGLLF